MRIFGKPKGAGTAVSLNNTEYGGLGDPIPMVSIGPPSSTNREDGEEDRMATSWGYAPGHHSTVTVTGLLPGESYIFAMAAFSSTNEVIGSGIGMTTPMPIVALEPLPIPLCLGYLAIAARDHGCPDIAKRASTLVYDRFIEYYGRGSGGSSTKNTKKKERGTEDDDISDDENTDSQPTSLVAPAATATTATNQQRKDPFGVETIDEKNPARAHVILRDNISKAPISILQTFIRSTFVLLDVTTIEKDHSTPMQTNPPGKIPNTTISLIPSQVSRIQSLQRLVCAVEAARMTVIKPKSIVVDPRRPSVGGDLVMEGVVRGYNWLEPILRKVFFFF